MRVRAGKRIRLEEANRYVSSMCDDGDDDGSDRRRSHFDGWNCSGGREPSPRKEPEEQGERNEQRKEEQQAPDEHAPGRVAEGVGGRVAAASREGEGPDSRP